MFYANDTSNNWNVTPVYSFETTEYKCCDCDYCIEELPYNVNESGKSYCLCDGLISAGNGINATSSPIYNTTIDCQGNSINSSEWGSDFSGVIFSSASHNNTVKNCYIDGFRRGIYLINATNITIEYCNITNITYYGIHASGGENQTIRYNIINYTYYSWDNYGIFFSSSNSHIHNNEIGNSTCASGWTCTGLGNFGNDNLIEYCNIRDNGNLGISSGGNRNLYRFNNVSGSNIGVSVSGSGEFSNGDISGNIIDYLIASNDFIFKNTNFTTSLIYISASTKIFSYNNESTEGITLNTSISFAGNITRELTSWKDNLMQWNDTNSSGSCTGTNTYEVEPGWDCIWHEFYGDEDSCNADPCCEWGMGCTNTICSSLNVSTCTSCGCSIGSPLSNYTVSGLKKYRQYWIYNNSNLINTLTTDNSGVLPRFSIALLGESEIEIRLIPKPPKKFRCEKELCYKNHFHNFDFIAKLGSCELLEYYPYFLIFDDTKDILWDIICLS